MSEAINVRRTWMEMMGLDDDEIELECGPGNVADLDEELSQYNAMVEIRAMNAQESAVGE